MSVDHLFQAYVDNSQTLTLGFALGTLTLVVIYLLNSLKDDGFAAEAAGSGNLQHIEETLRKLLEGAQFSGANAGAANAAVPGSSDPAAVPKGTERPIVNVIDNAEVDKLRAMVAEKDHKLGELESAFAKVLKQAAEKGSEDDLKSLHMQVKDLEAKLAEYEIIEDDIANLTTYKEENHRLKDELARLAAGGSVSSAPAAPVFSGEPAAVDEALMAEFEAAVDEQKKAAATTPSSVGPSVGTGPGSSLSTPPTAIDDALMSEFANAVKPAAVTNAPEPTVVSAPSAPSSPGPEDPMLMANVATETGELPAVLNTQFDPDTMLSEVQAIDVNAPVVADGQDEGEKLIAEFENFMDKN